MFTRQDSQRKEVQDAHVRIYMSKMQKARDPCDDDFRIREKKETVSEL
jgi:hypothetical protein